MKDGVGRCQEWLPVKNRLCAAAALPNSLYCGNHKPCSADTRIPCPVDPSHTILRGEAESHARRCPSTLLRQQMEQLSYYCKGINVGSDDEVDNATIDSKRLEVDGHACERVELFEEDHVSSKVKRSLVKSLSKVEMKALIAKIELAYDLHCTDEFQFSFESPGACKKWVAADIDRRIPFQEKHILQQASILGNMERYGLLRLHNSHCNAEHIPSCTGSEPVFIEFGAGRGYLAHMLADCYNAQKIMLVERRSYKFKADRTLRQSAGVTFERVRIDIADLKLDGVKGLHDCHYVTLSKHLCGYATDLTLRCCKPDMKTRSERCHLDGIAIATCCHHLCQWKPYVNKKFFKQLGFSKREFLVLTWLTSGAVSGDIEHHTHLHSHSTSAFSEARECPTNFEYSGKEKSCSDVECFGEEKAGNNASVWLTNLINRAELGLKCKQLLDVGRLAWLKEVGLHAKLVTYAPPEITPENTLLLARHLKAGETL